MSALELTREGICLSSVSSWELRAAWKLSRSVRKAPSTRKLLTEAKLRTEIVRLLPETVAGVYGWESGKSIKRSDETQTARGRMNIS